MTSFRSDLVVIAAAISVGVHASLVPEHLREGAAAGGGFIAATVLLAVLILALSSRPDSVTALSAIALVFGGLLISYALVVTSGMPPFHPEPERVYGLALATKAVELTGLAVALDQIRRCGTARLPFFLNRAQGERA